VQRKPLWKAQEEEEEELKMTGSWMSSKVECPTGEGRRHEC